MKVINKAAKQFNEVNQFKTKSSVFHCFSLLGCCQEATSLSTNMTMLPEVNHNYHVGINGKEIVDELAFIRIDEIKKRS